MYVAWEREKKTRDHGLVSGLQQCFETALFRHKCMFIGMLRVFTDMDHRYTTPFVPCDSNRQYVHRGNK